MLRLAEMKWPVIMSAEGEVSRRAAYAMAGKPRSRYIAASRYQRRRRHGAGAGHCDASVIEIAADDIIRQFADTYRDIIARRFEASAQSPEKPCQPSRRRAYRHARYSSRHRCLILGDGSLSRRRLLKYRSIMRGITRRHASCVKIAFSFGISKCQSLHRR